MPKINNVTTSRELSIFHEIITNVGEKIENTNI